MLSTGHAFRRSSATIVANAGASTTALKLHGGWKSATVAESYVDNSTFNKNQIATMIGTQIGDSIDNDQTSEPQPKKQKTSKFRYKTPVFSHLPMFSHLREETDNSELFQNQHSQQLSQISTSQLSEFIIEDFVDEEESTLIPQSNNLIVIKSINCHVVLILIIDVFFIASEESRNLLRNNHFNFNNCSVTLHVHGQ